MVAGYILRRKHKMNCVCVKSTMQCSLAMFFPFGFVALQTYISHRRYISWGKSIGNDNIDDFILVQRSRLHSHRDFSMKFVKLAVQLNTW